MQNEILAFPGEQRTQERNEVFMCFKSHLSIAVFSAFIMIIPGSETGETAAMHFLLTPGRSCCHQHSQFRGRGVALGHLSAV